MEQIKGITLEGLRQKSRQLFEERLKSIVRGIDEQLVEAYVDPSNQSEAYLEVDFRGWLRKESSIFLSSVLECYPQFDITPVYDNHKQLIQLIFKEKVLKQGVYR